MNTIKNDKDITIDQYQKDVDRLFNIVKWTILIINTLVAILIIATNN